MRYLTSVKVRDNLFANKLNRIIILRITYNGRLPEGVGLLTPSKLGAYVNLNNQIESNNEKKTKKNKASNFLNFLDQYVSYA